MPKNYASRKAALLDAGRIQEITRGRISRENNAWLDEQIIAGNFTVSDISLKASTGPTPAPPTVQRHSQTSETGVVEVRNPTRDLYALDCNADTGMKGVCLTCGSSYTYCPCEFPRGIVKGSESVVVFKPRTRPLPVNPWG